jgi:hypothetical protein
MLAIYVTSLNYEKNVKEILTTVLWSVHVLVHPQTAIFEIIKKICGMVVT